MLIKAIIYPLGGTVDCGKALCRHILMQFSECNHEKIQDHQASENKNAILFVSVLYPFYTDSLPVPYQKLNEYIANKDKTGVSFSSA